MLRFPTRLALVLLLGWTPGATAQEAFSPVDQQAPLELPAIAIEPAKTTPPAGTTAFQGPVEEPAARRNLTGTKVRLAARLVEGGEEIGSGMTWRIFSPNAGTNGKLPLMATHTGGSSDFSLPPGSYLVHAAFGRAGATKRITVGKEAKNEEIVLDAGGLKLSALLAGGKEIPADKLRFSIYEEKQDAAGNRQLVIPDVKPAVIVRLNAGVYHVVSNYGSANAVVRSDIRVEAGKLTEAMVEHKAAQLTLKLVRETGGEALAETSWSVVNDSGDPILETVGPYATFVLSEGNYTIVAKNRERIFQQELTVESGRDAEIDVIANAQSEVDQSEGAE